jgi:hypothetical protein
VVVALPREQEGLTDRDEPQQGSGSLHHKIADVRASGAVRRHAFGLRSHP